MIGKSISQYKIVSKLGEGGMGVVYKAEDTKLKRTVAIKFLPHHIAATPEERERFTIEAQAAAALNHPNIATIHNIEEVRGEKGEEDVFIVMEYMAGQELKEKIDSGPLEIEAVIDLTTQIAQGLKAAHDNGVIHRDIKSANIILTSDGRVKIMDFGLAKMGGQGKLTNVGTTLGTAAYMSPEQTRGEEVDQRSDLFSLGVLLYEMLTGEMPFKGGYEQAVIYAILNEDPEAASKHRPDLPEEIESIVSRALAKDPKERFQSADEMLMALKGLSGPTQPSQQTTLRPHSARSGSRFWPAIWATAAVVIIAGLAAFFFLGKAESTIDTLAILPFENQSDNSEMDYLSDGVPETLIFELSRLPDLKVRSLNAVSSYRVASPDILQIAQDLDVKAVLTGRLSVRLDKLVIAVELIDGQDNSIIWGDRYNREMADLLEVQKELVDDILLQLRFELSGSAEDIARPLEAANSEAYDAYLRARLFVKKRNEADFRKAFDYYKQAIELAPRYAEPYAGLADAYYISAIYGYQPMDEAIVKVRSAAVTAINLNDRLAEAHMALSHAHMYDRDYSGALKAKHRAIELNPNFADAYHHLSYLLAELGQMDGAIEAAKKAHDLEPLSAVMTRGLGIVYIFARRYDLANRYLKDCLEINENSLSGAFHLAVTHHLQGQPDSSTAMLSKYLNILGDEEKAAGLKEIYADSGFAAVVRDFLSAKELGFLEDLTYKAIMLAWIGDKEEALDSLQKANAENSRFINSMSVYPVVDNLRDDPRFIAIEEEVFRNIRE